MEQLEFAQFSEYLQPRRKDAHKGDFGHVLIIGGEAGYSGAVLLAAKAALRIGAGLVSVATHPAHAAVLNLTQPEVMCHGIKTPNELTKLITKATTLVIGPGLGQTDWSHALWAAALGTDKPTVLDADGLNLLAEKPVQRTNWILTPHPGEAGRLLGITTAEIQQDRLSAVIALQRKFNGIAVLKGAGTLVVGAEASPAMCSAGNPGMATAGMGDVQSGVLGGLLAQKLPLLIAAKLGVLIHATAGDLAAKEGGERGMIASDLMPYLRQLGNDFI